MPKWKTNRLFLIFFNETKSSLYIYNGTGVAIFSQKIKSYEKDPTTVKHAVFLISGKAQAEC